MRPAGVLAFAFGLGGCAWRGRACTNLIVSPGASADGSTIFSYTADSGALYGTLGHYPAGKHALGSKRKIWDWDSGIYLGEIDEAPETFNVIGNLNEHGVAIGETTFGGNVTLAGGEGLLDYGSLIWVTLQRARDAREAIGLFGSLTSEYGYVSEGESFTIGDAKEVWLLEMIGKGKYEKGAVWVAVRIPDGHVSGHANQARIQRFPLNDPENCMYSPDVISFAKKIGLWGASRVDAEFSFSDLYDPITFSGARQSDARVWSFFASVAEDPHFEKAYENYVLGRNLTAAARMPLHIKPKAKISATDIMMHMRNHYEGTVLDPSHDVGAQASGSPYRTRPIAWKHGNNSYVNERTVGTQQAGWNFVAQLRGHLPAPIGGLLWFGVDDATFSVHMPFHGGTTRVPKSLADGNGDALNFSYDSAFWAFNTVANFVYPRWYLAPSVIARSHAAEVAFADVVAQEEKPAVEMYEKEPAKAMEYLTDLAERRADEATKSEFQLFGELMVRSRDGFQISSQGPNAPDHGGHQGGIVPKVEEVGYSDSWYARIVQDTKDHYKMADDRTHPDLMAHQAMKLRVLAKGTTSALRGAAPGGAAGVGAASIVVV
mmetsp:Transcript_39325/g.124828  ORF Transcript_39325/g.124828 Transcript_39325/m.124828 type:complete len:602 (+) Transcript_39325:113-1918(+)